MKEILSNLALLDTINWCKSNNVDCSGTKLVKYNRRFTYALYKDITGKAIVTVTYYKNRTPSYFNHDFLASNY